MSLFTTFLFNYYKKDKFTIIIIIILSIIINILQINLTSILIGNLINCLQKNDIKNGYKNAYYFILASIIIIGIQLIFKYLSYMLSINFRNFSGDELLKIVMNTHNENLGNVNFTKLTNPIFRITYSFVRLLDQIIKKFIPDFSLLFTVFGYFIYKYPNLGFIFLIGNLVIIAYLWYSYKIILHKSINLESEFTLKEFSIIEVFNNLEKIISKGEVKNELNNFNDLTDNIKNIAISYNYYYNWNSFILNVICYTIIIVSILYSIYLFKIKKIDVGMIVTLITIIIMYRDFLIKFFDEIPAYIDLFARINTTIKLSFKEILQKFNNDFNNEIIDIPKIDNLPIIKNIKFSNISFIYEQNNKLIFNNLNLEINVEDKIIGIVGDSGFGKSTLMKLLIKLYKYDGNILINDIDIQKIDTRILRKKINYVNQNSKLFDKKIIKNITYGLKNNDSYKFYLSEIMKFERINNLFKNIDIELTNCGFSGESLSGGQRQVINLINGLVQDSDIIILDEPTNALNYELKMEIIKMIKYFKKYKKTIIIISHDKDIYPIFDKVIDINKVRKT